MNLFAYIGASLIILSGIISVPGQLKQIDELFAIWEDYANQELPLVYKSTKWTKKEQKQNFNYLLKSIELGQAGLAKLPATPQSLREAEQEQLLYYWSENEDVAE